MLQNAFLPKLEVIKQADNNRPIPIVEDKHGKESDIPENGREPASSAEIDEEQTSFELMRKLYRRMQQENELLAGFAGTPYDKYTSLFLLLRKVKVNPGSDDDEKNIIALSSQILEAAKQYSTLSGIADHQDAKYKTAERDFLKTVNGINRMIEEKIPDEYLTPLLLFEREMKRVCGELEGNLLTLVTTEVQKLRSLNPNNPQQALEFLKQVKLKIESIKSLVNPSESK